MHTTQTDLRAGRAGGPGKGPPLSVAQRAAGGGEHLPRRLAGRSRQPGGAGHAAPGPDRPVRRRIHRRAASGPRPCCRRSDERLRPGLLRRHDSRAVGQGRDGPARAQPRRARAGTCRPCTASSGPKTLAAPDNPDAILRWNTCAASARASLRAPRRPSPAMTHDIEAEFADEAPQR